MLHRRIVELQLHQEGKALKRVYEVPPDDPQPAMYLKSATRGVAVGPNAQLLTGLFALPTTSATHTPPKINGVTSTDGSGG